VSAEQTERDRFWAAVRKVQEAGSIVMVSSCLKASLYACVLPQGTKLEVPAALQYRDVALDEASRQYRALKIENDNLHRSTRVAWEQAEKEIHAALGISREQLELVRGLLHGASVHCERPYSCGDPKCGTELYVKFKAWDEGGRPLLEKMKIK